ncbi:MAG: hypothetical protein LM632_08895 [Armatimonadetes bacterium]|nr:hypothetical protein [Armatimonadota bacterium]
MRLLHLKLMKFWIVALLFFIPSHSFAQRWRYCLLVAPESYPLRWGEREPPDADMVAMPPGLDTSRTIPTSPGCYKVGKSGFWLSYSVENAGLVGGLFVVVWDGITGETVWQRYYYPVWREGVVSLDGLVLPSYITVLGFQVVWLGYGSMFTRFTVFVVLDAPKPPMSPAWVSLLRYSCRWARGTSNLDDAAQAITFGVFFQRPGFAYPRDTASHWLNGTTFMLKALLDEWNAGRWTDGNCADVSCLTMLALCSVGLDFSVRQLTGTLLPPPPYCGRNCPPPWEDGPIGFHFHTHDICSIGSDPTVDWTYKWWAWGWHQVCVLTGAPDPPSNDAGIWDPTAAQKEDLNGNGYRNPPAHHPNHLWWQKDYWQKSHTRVPGAWLGLVNEPIQGANDPQLYGLGTWKCGVSAGSWQP